MSVEIYHKVETGLLMHIAVLDCCERRSEALSQVILTFQERSDCSNMTMTAWWLPPNRTRAEMQSDTYHIHSSIKKIFT